MQKKLGDQYRESRLADNQKDNLQYATPGQFHFTNNRLLFDLEKKAVEVGLQFIEELIFENGAVYKGKDSN